MMTLHEAIQTVLNENNRPMRAKEIASAINVTGYYLRGDREPVKVDQIYARVKNYPSLFQNVNGHIVLVHDYYWKNILTSYEYLTHVLRGIFIQADIQFIVAVLFYYKRLVDINSRSGRNYPLAFDEELLNSLDGFIDAGRSLIEGLNSLGDYRIAPEGVFDECSRLLSKLDRSKIQEIWSVVKQIDTKHLSDHEFGNIYEYLITVVSLGGNKSSLNHTPYSLRELMVDLLDIRDGGSLYDPVAGMGGLLIEASLKADNDISTYGSEINRRIAQLGNMNLSMHGLNMHIEAEDCFGQINNRKEYDYIIADLPANGITNSLEYFELYSQFSLSAPKSGKSFGAMVLFALSKLKATGKAVLTVSDGFLVKKGIEQSIRELLIQNDIIETVISLPYGTLRPYTDAKSSILILNNSKASQLRNRVHFITANIIEQTAKSVILNNDEIIRLYLEKETFDKNGQLVDIEDLRPGANLLVESYDAQFLLANTMLKEGKAKFLTDLVEVKAGISPDKSAIYADGDIPLIKVERLSKDILDNNLNIQNIDGINDSVRYERNLVFEECILVARIGDNLKATIFKPTNEIPTILPHNNVYVLIPKNRLELSIEYLYYQLHSTFIQGQIEKRKLGAVMPYISMAGLKETVIPYMTLEAQNEFVQSQKANLISEERKRVEDRIKALGYKEETKQAEADVIKILTHQLRPMFSGLNGVTKRLQRIVQREKIGQIKEYDKIELNVDSEIENQIAVPDNFTIGQLLDKLAKESKHLSDILTNVDKVMNFKLLPEDLSEVNILNFLQEYRAQKAVEQNGKYSIEVKGDSVTVLLHKASFRELLDQLLINAEKHAFNFDKKTNKIIFTVRYLSRRNVISIEYFNNGNPYELTQKDFTTAFEKGNKSNGSGIGGNYISRIVEAHNGKLIVEENNKKGFFLTIELPTSNNIIYE
ncbi:N-6 DNA methylase [Sphingobacterium faecium]|uniref:N-6 DNA methylase n=1 Tax=Sphingobacterium faecium TaxID=34087 RepID=UPI0012929E97|nr:N-6 DNA methylase [Sphingobacterium faecium]MQP29605.1 N-6 DNA methylase [Sphingobacterium faecium]